MKKSDYDFILPFFCSIDEQRLIPNKPYYVDGNVYAINAEMMIRIEQQHLYHTYNTNEKYPSAAKLFNEFKYLKRKTLKTDALIHVLSLMKWTQKKDLEKCTHCDDDGFSFCAECENDHPCKNCNGKGYREKGDLELSLLKTTDQRAVIRIDKKYFNPNHIHTLTISAKILGENTVDVLINEDDHAPDMFILGRAFVIVHPRVIGDDFLLVYNVKK